MRNPTSLSLLFFIFALVQFVYAFPTIDTRPRSTVVERQNDAPFNGPVTVKTVETSNTAAGVVTVTCTITLTPIVVNGQNLVREEKDCTTTTAQSSNPPDTGSPPNTGSQLTPPAVVSDTIATVASVPPQVTAISTIAVVTPVFPDATSAPSAASANLPTPTADAANASQTTSFTLPGQKLQVLPIGLGVFAGISVIALIVVGLVTYERTKYRKAFRARKLAESGASMGYGGTGT